MTPEQELDFKKRRMRVVQKHLKNDPKYRKMRRARRLGLISSVLGSVVTLGVFLLLLKSFVLALNGPRDYAALVAPMVEGQGESSVVAQLLGVDPISLQIAGFIGPMLPSVTNVAASTVEAPRP
ncbi:MAG: hypothetical protein EA339_15050 [Rhodobacteraceae bacterium]|nr:MAG: hypothetical protein EA339_15050 [Paracoccaceae bacterium]